MESGCTDKDVAFFRGMTACADYGTPEGAGYAVDIATWRPGQTDCCTLRIRAPQRT